MSYSGWIIVGKGEEEHVKNLGVVLLDKVEELALSVEYRCRVEEDVMKRLDEYWGQYIWGLVPDGEKPPCS